MVAKVLSLEYKGERQQFETLTPKEAIYRLLIELKYLEPILGLSHLIYPKKGFN